MLHRITRPLLYLLAFQLAVGMQASIAYAIGFAPAQHMSGMHTPGCDEHMTSDARPDHPQPRAAAQHTSGSIHHHSSGHHCCGSDGCQCHTPSTPAVPSAIGFPLPVTPPSILPELAHELPAAPVSQRLRPPIV